MLQIVTKCNFFNTFDLLSTMPKNGDLVNVKNIKNVSDAQISQLTVKSNLKYTFSLILQ